ncbi:oligomeric Golgi complex subunit 6 [Polychytrium aggregatum]|uniref:oligomeric Golgi complex subunit 6 n=1 Tax=Polychytrium aggregatum TaxID=110093 RepID=UPI0022FF0D67|nr:oligomeric Golgi complex subunit 6 [Polychytrium aggregatum]KAI9209389.1 oligomeric Golgi complex subunit 6 [Polychytrium aggregatum]
MDTAEPAIGAAADLSGATPQSKLAHTNPLAKKLAQVLTISLEDQQTQNALEALSEFYVSSKGTSKRSFRADVERRVILMNNRFLDSLNGINQAFLDIEKQVTEMNSQCQEMEDKLKTANERTFRIVSRIKDMKESSQRALIRKSLAEAFVKRFTLSDQEIQILTTPHLEINKSFFDALDHLHQINEDCRALLVTDHQHAGLEIMDSITIYQDLAYEKLFKWTQAQCRGLTRDMPDLNRTLKDAMRALKLRPVLFQTCVEDVCHIRRTAVGKAFLDALTRGGPGGFPRPMELHAHDPLRYAGEMLAWVHQASVGEHEMLEGLFDIRKKPALHSPIRTQSSAEEDSPSGLESLLDDSDVVERILNKGLEGVCRPLRARLESIIATQQKPLVNYKLMNLVQFYYNTVSRVLGSSAELTITLHEIEGVANHAFFENLNGQASEMIKAPEAPKRDLLPSPTINDAVSQLKEIMTSYQSSLVPHEEREKDFANLLRALLDPLLQVCVLGSAALSTFESAIYMANCLYHVQTTLKPYPFTDQQIAALEGQIQHQLETLIQEQHTTILKRSGLAYMVETMDKNDKHEPLALLPGMDARSISDAMSQLDTFLCNVAVEASSLLARLTSSRLAKTVVQRALRLFVDDYSRFHDAVMDPSNRYEFPSTILARTVGEVETLLGDDLL